MKEKLKEVVHGAAKDVNFDVDEELAKVDRRECKPPKKQSS